MFRSLHLFMGKFLSEDKVDTILINIWCFINIRLISFVGVRIVKADESGTIVRLKVNRKTKNHLNSMYMGAQIIGAEIGPIFYAIKYCELRGYQINSEYKDVKASFMKKTRGKYVYFHFEDTKRISDILEECSKVNERKFDEVTLKAYDSDDFNSKSLVSEFNFTATFRKRRSR